MVLGPALSGELVRGAAVLVGACVRPVLSRVTDTTTGDVRTVTIACGATREAVCPSCAERARRLRMQQCREGWHLDTEPELAGPDATEGDDETPTVDDEDDATERRVRSTRRREDVPDLPRLPVSGHTVGRTFDAPDGKTYRPSMFLTLTMPSYGRVTDEGVPVDPDRYDYRRAALDAMHFPKLVDRFWQNLRRATGYNVQYFAAVEPQQRLAPHLHAAIRGAIPRKLIKQVVAATYHQVWWPGINHVHHYRDGWPAWDEEQGGYVDDGGWMLPTWDEAMDYVDNGDGLDLGEEPEPVHVLRFGVQVDLQGILAGTPAADRRVGYLTKYLTKSIAEPLDIDDPNRISAARRAHIDRLAEEVRWLPCSPTCANWLRYGTQPKNAKPGMEPGRCTSKAHDRDHLGLGGRRVLVSRKWTGKTLTEHRADRAAVVRAVLAEAGIEMDDHDQLSATATAPDGKARYIWTPVRPGDPDAPSYVWAVAKSIAQRRRWREQYDAAKQATGPPSSDVSATDPSSPEGTPPCPTT
ncbi:replication initiation protein [Jiangella aurantiaca]|uniref:Replication initiation protein n=1 Tax=Jiangella aurantiaca TaxID=2530373 RepID=A0A4R5A4F9_9ACTN|nr:replication initiation protein [Jiangella aurantiaca]